MFSEKKNSARNPLRSCCQGRIQEFVQGGGLSPHSHPLNTPLADVVHSDTYFGKIVKIKTNVIESFLFKLLSKEIRIFLHHTL